MNTSRLATAALSAGVLALGLSACAKDTSTTTTESGVNLVEEGTLTICTHLPYEPFEFTEGGEVVGFDVDVLKIAADAEGLETKVVDTAWETIVSGSALDNGDCDVAAGAMTITPEREAVMDFSDPYFEATQALLVPSGSGITSLDDLAGKRIATQEGTTGEAYVKENLPKGAKAVSFEDSVLMMEAVRSGKADAGVNDNGLVNYYVEQNPEVEVTTEFKTGEEYGFSVKKDGNDELLKVLNDAIANQEEYDKAYEKWFGSAPAE
ncbi:MULTISPECIES: transporter substrate-binding domain-containing protein [Nocardioides]|uniref:Transporter substrate-binding domain-containing protein n=1 Tax=Nocardioides vastitatis TaxID=2568655 RepID=A0ABW0Z8R4_9ACTN|nr:transporter substrate-binding domain-containing protein [Nocardioides sp.]THI95321.1 transporter substrate-binding domain-containing protein [Nocardioides sp.]